MDPAQIAELRRWARGLAGSGDSAELRAAARAILLLADEVDHLAGELAARAAPVEATEPEEAEAPPPPAAPDAAERGGAWESLKASWSRWRTPDAQA